MYENYKRNDISINGLVEGFILYLRNEAGLASSPMGLLYSPETCGHGSPL